jgi:superfamily II DNA or RNA helicase
MSATLEITAHRGSLWIQPASLTGFLKAQLQYWQRYTPSEVKEFLDSRTGFMVTREVRTNEVKVVKVNLYREEGNYLVAHEGVLNRVLHLCAQAGYDVNYVKLPPLFPQPRFDPGVVRGLMPDQVECFVSIMSAVGSPGLIGGSGALIQATMGAGKTWVIAALCRAYRRNVMVVTRGKAVVRRLHTGLTDILADDGLSVGIYQGATKVRGDITVTTAKLMRHFDPDEIDVLIFDECHHAAGNQTSVEVMGFDKAIKIGLSATIKDRFDGKDALLQALFGPMVYELTDQQAEELGRVVPMKVFALQVPFGPSTSTWKSMVAKERNAIWRNMHRNKAIQDVAETVPPDQQLIVFVATKEHGEILQRGFLQGYPFYHGDMSDGEQRPLLAAFESGELKRLIATDSIGEGVDPQNLMVVIDANWKTSSTQVPQRAGRNRRHGVNKTWGVLVTFQDDFDDLARQKSNERLSQYRKRGYQVTLIAHPSSIEYVVGQRDGEDESRDSE